MVVDDSAPAAGVPKQQSTVTTGDSSLGKPSPRLSARDKWSGGCCSCCCVLCPSIPDPEFLESVTTAHFPALRDEHSPAWEPLIAEKAQKAMGANQSSSFLFWLLFRADVITMRLQRAFDTRPAGWTATFILMFSSIYSYFLQVHFATTQRCVFVDTSSGEEYFDYCTARAA